jgi:hypothetical protein
MERDGGNPRVLPGSCEAHRGLLVDDLATVLGCGASEKLREVVGEVNVVAAGS